MGQRGDHAPCEIERDVAQLPEVVFDVVPEDPQEEHVEPQMQPVSVEEHRCSDGDPRSLRLEDRSSGGVFALASTVVAGVGGSDLTGAEWSTLDDFARDGRVLVAELDSSPGVSAGLYEDEDSDVDDDQRDRDPCQRLGGVLVVKGDHDATLMVEVSGSGGSVLR